MFSTVDATSGFLQLCLDESSSKLTTFATPFGRWRFLRLPFGISSAPEVFHRTVTELFADIEGVEVYIDDLLIHGCDKSQHDERLRAVLDRCRTANFKLNLSKCRFECSSLKYLGHIVGEGCVKADPEKIRATTEFPTPKSKEDLRRLLGMVTYLGKFYDNLATVTAPLRELTKKNVSWQWCELHQTALERLKLLLSSSPVLRMFDPELPVVLSVDASQHGLGAVVLQNGQPVEFASCSLSSAQQRYSQIEKEFLAVQFGLIRLHQFVYGQHVEIETDHRPLLGIVRKDLNALSPRLLRMRLRNQVYDYSLVYKPGKTLVLADTLSRAHVPEPYPESSNHEKLDFEQVHAVYTGFIQCDNLSQKVVDETTRDPVLHIVQDYIERGWPSAKRSCNNAAKPYWAFRSDLISYQGFLLKGSQVVIPAGLRIFFLKNVHQGHLGISKCLQRAKGALFWPRYTT